MSRALPVGVALIALLLSGCVTTQQVADAEFRPPQGNYSLLLMRPKVTASLLTAGGQLEQREDWTNQAREYVLKAIQSQQAGRGGAVKVAATYEQTGADPALVADLDRLHDVVGHSIRIHKFAGMPLPTKKSTFDWTLGNEAVKFGQVTGYEYALFVHTESSFSSSGRSALQAVSFLGCMFGVCVIPTGGLQIAFASLVDLKTGRIVWYNFLASEIGDIRTEIGAAKMVERLLDRMKPGSSVAVTKKT